VFDDELPKNPALLDAFHSALTRIREREAEQKLTPSNPRLFVGGAIARRLAR
jgi:hypothetical protein